MILCMLLKTPTGLTLTPPPPLEDGTVVATPEQLAIGQELQNIKAEWLHPIGESGADTLWRVIVRGTDLAAVEDLITQYSLPLTIMHAQDAYETQQGVTMVDGMEVPVMGATVHKQGLKADILPFMPADITYDTDGTILSSTPATSVTIPQCSDMAAIVI